MLIGKAVVRFTQKIERRCKMTNTMSELGNIATDFIDIKKIIKENWKISTNKCKNLDEMDRFLERFTLPELT